MGHPASITANAANLFLGYMFVPPWVPWTSSCEVAAAMMSPRGIRLSDVGHHCTGIRDSPSAASPSHGGL